MNFPQLKRFKKNWFDKNFSFLCRCNYQCELCKWYRTLCIGIPFYDLDLLPNIITAITGIRIQELHYQFILYLKIQYNFTNAHTTRYPFFYYCALSIHQKTHNTYKPYFAITQQSLYTMSTSIGDALLFCTQLFRCGT